MREGLLRLPACLLACLLASGPALSGCAQEGPAPYAEMVLRVDTNLPVPLVSRLRVDLYTEAGAWFDSRDIARPDPRDWPASFSLFSTDEAARSRVWARLRVYPEAGVRDYQGERFSDWGASLEPPSGDGLPRLLVDGRDITPALEPLPLLSVDRLLLLELIPGEQRQLSVVLDGACAGSMAELGGGGPFAGLAHSCVDTFGAREPVVATKGAPLSEPEPSVVGSFSAAPCPEDAGGERVCIPGGAFILGSQELFLVPDLPALPERLVQHERFWLDRHEVSVGRYRAALDSGFVPPTPPNEQNQELGAAINQNCAFSAEPLGREDYALSCVDWPTARALCQFFGGDLPSEAQWEYAASRRSDSRRSKYPWGDDAPDCQRAVYGRAALAGFPGVCETEGSGPLPVGAGGGDTSLDGVEGLAGGVSEWCLDSYQSYAGECWAQSTNQGPGCLRDDAQQRAVRGGAWASPTPNLRSQARAGAPPKNRVSFIGLRCAYTAGQEAP